MGGRLLRSMLGGVPSYRRLSDAFATFLYTFRIYTFSDDAVVTGVYPQSFPKRTTQMRNNILPKTSRLLHRGK